MLFRNLVAVILLLASATAMAKEVDLTLSDNSALFRYIQHANTSYGNSQYDAGFLYTDSNDFLLMLGFQVEGEAGSGSPGLQLGIGVKAFSVNTDTFDLLAFAIGGELRYSLPSQPRLGFRGQIYHAPNIVTFMDADNLTYGTLAIEYELLQQATVYLGYRSVTADILGNNNAEIDDDTHIGFRIVF
jgi:hypothetical protein